MSVGVIYLLVIIETVDFTLCLMRERFIFYLLIYVYSATVVGSY